MKKASRGNRAKLISVATVGMFILSGYVLPPITAFAVEEPTVTQEEVDQAKSQLETPLLGDTAATTQPPEKTTEPSDTEPQEELSDNTAADSVISAPNSELTAEDSRLDQLQSATQDSDPDKGIWEKGNDTVNWSVTEEPNGNCVLELSDGILTTASSDQTPWRSDKYKNKITEVRFRNVEGGNTLNALFYQMGSLKKVDFTGLDTSIVTEMAHMLGATSIEQVDLTKLNTENVSVMASLFLNCKLLKEADLSELITNNVENINTMFSGCEALKTVDLSCFYTNVEFGAYKLFNECLSLEELTINSQFKLNSNMFLRKLPGFDGMYKHYWVRDDDSQQQFSSTDEMINSHRELSDSDDHTYTIEKKVGGIWKSKNGDQVNWTVVYEDGEFVLVLSNGTVNSATNESTPWREEPYNELITQVRFESVTGGKELFHLFKDMRQLKYVDFSGLDSRNVTNMFEMFANCSALKELNLEGLNVENVFLFSAMFQGCSSLETLDLSTFKNKGQVNTNAMFDGCTNLSEIDLSSLKTRDKGQNMNSMFNNCPKLTTLTLSNQFEFINNNFKLADLPAPINAGKTTYHWVTEDLTTVYDSTADFVEGHNNYLENGPITYKIKTRHNVSFDVNGGSGSVADQSIFDGEKATTPSYDGTNEHHQLDGWLMNDQSFDFETPIQSPLDLKANWRLNQYTVRFYSNEDNEQTHDQSFDYNEEKNLMKNSFEKTGYHFTGWATDREGSGAAYEDEQLVKNLADEDGAVVKLYAQWSPNKYDIVFMPNGGTEQQRTQADIPYDQEQNLMKNDFTRTGYRFTEWNTAADGSGASYEDEASVKNLTAVDQGTFTLQAQWEAINYQVNFDSQGGESIQPMTYTIEQGIDSLPTPTRNGYEFLGWYDGDSKVENIPVGSTNDRNLVAHWKANEYILSFNSDGGSEVDPVTFTPVQEVTDLPTPTKKGYTFLGWYDGDEKVTKLEKGTVGDLTLTAKWELITYTLTFSTVGEPIAPINYTIDSVIELPKLTRKGYTFLGWLATEAPKSRAIAAASERILTRIEAGTIGNLALTEKWQANEYAIQFDANGGSGAMTPQKMTYDQAAKLTRSTMTRVGYRFDGWNTQADGKGAALTDEQEVKNLVDANNGSITLYAQWKATNSELEELVKQEKDKHRNKNNYSDASWQTYEAALKEAEALLADPAADPDAVEAAVKNLKQAVSDLMPIQKGSTVTTPTKSTPTPTSTNRRTSATAKSYPGTGMLTSSGLMLAGFSAVAAAIASWRKYKK